MDLGKTNLHGGSLSLGHPFAATGNRLMTTAANRLHRCACACACVCVCVCVCVPVCVSCVCLCVCVWLCVCVFFLFLRRRRRCCSPFSAD